MARNVDDQFHGMRTVGALSISLLWVCALFFLATTCAAQLPPAEAVNVRTVDDSELFAFVSQQQVPWNRCRFFDVMNCDTTLLSHCIATAVCVDEFNKFWRVPIGGEPSENKVFRLPFYPRSMTITDLESNGSEDFVMVPAAGGTRNLLVMTGESSELKTIQLPISKAHPFDGPVMRINDVLLDGINLRRELRYYSRSGADKIRVDHLRLAGDALLVVNEVYADDKYDRPTKQLLHGQESATSYAIDPPLLTLNRSVPNRPLGRWDVPPPRGYSWVDTLSGDFNGDTNPDILLLTEPRRWWLLSFAGSIPEPRPVTGLPAELNDSTKIAAGDIDRDGQMDVVIQTPGALKWYRGVSHPVEGVSLFLGDRFLGRTNASGDVLLPEPLPSGQRIEMEVPLQGGGIRRFPTKIAFPIRQQRISTVVLTPAHFRRDQTGEMAQAGPALPGPFRCPGQPAVWAKPSSTLLHCDSESYIVRLEGGGSGDASRPPQAFCCALPEPGILTGESVEVRGDCPPNSIVTGIAAQFLPPVHYPLPVACSFVDAQKWSVRTPSEGQPRTQHAGSDEACGGANGAPLTGVSGADCGKMRFAEIETVDHVPLQLVPGK